jgi:hypothetical protein
MFDAEKAAQNAKRIESELDTLKGGHWRSPLQRDYRAFWAHVKEINELFKTLKPLDRNEIGRLREKMNNICENTKNKQQQEIDNRNHKSKQHRDWIIKQAESCRPIQFIFIQSNVEEMKDAGRRLKEIGQYLSRYKEEMTYEDKAECFERIQDVRKAQDLWWDGHKQHRQQRADDFRDRVRANIDKNKEKYERAADALRKMNASADDLRDKISSAYNDNWRDKAYGWLSELEDKIRDTESHLRRLEEWIEEDERKLRG